jgi:hypothetical protein
MVRNEILAVFLQIIFVMFVIGLIFRMRSSSKKFPHLARSPFRLFRLLLIIATFGVLGGCANPDPLAVASGPIFALNAGHWQPAPQDLAGPPVIPK